MVISLWYSHLVTNLLHISWKLDRCNNIRPAVACRLEMRLKKYGLCERKIKGDGNCQFRAGERDCQCSLM